MDKKKTLKINKNISLPEARQFFNIKFKKN